MRTPQPGCKNLFSIWQPLLHVHTNGSGAWISPQRAITAVQTIIFLKGVWKGFFSYLVWTKKQTAWRQIRNMILWLKPCFSVSKKALVIYSMAAWNEKKNLLFLNSVFSSRTWWMSHRRCFPRSCYFNFSFFCWSDTTLLCRTYCSKGLSD